MRTKYTKEVLETAVQNSHSIADVIRQLGMKFSGGLHGHLTSKIKLWGIDTSHFSRNGCNKGKPPFNKRHWSEILIFQTRDIREDTKTLRRALIESGRIYKCEECDLPPVWNKKPICIQTDHKDGNWRNNVPTNLRFLCPNCHSQTSTYGVKNSKFANVAQRKEALA